MTAVCVEHELSALCIVMKCCNCWGWLWLRAPFPISFPAPNGHYISLLAMMLQDGRAQRSQYPGDRIVAREQTEYEVRGANEQCVQHCALQMYRRGEAGRMSWGVPARTPAAGKVVWMQGLLGCFNLNLKELEKKAEDWKGVWRIWLELGSTKPLPRWLFCARGSSLH